ncbi:MAG: hypothetical protein LBK97_03785 [Prevotellaceae bacterium]|jgi:hypothetical protein|nr:hypothetical protein [Prevotellaceae bacterium]
MISEEVMSDIQWIFSGIGCVVLTLAVGFFYKKKKNGKQAENPLQIGSSQKLAVGEAEDSPIIQKRTVKAENPRQIDSSQELSVKKAKRSPITQTQTINKVIE